MAEQSGERFPPSISVAKLYERTSQRGRLYMTGRMGGVKIAVLKTDDADDEGHPIWEMKFSPAPPSKAKAADKAPRPSASPERPGFGSRTEDDVIPF